MRAPTYIGLSPKCPTAVVHPPLHHLKRLAGHPRGEVPRPVTAGILRCGASGQCTCDYAGCTSMRERVEAHPPMFLAMARWKESEARAGVQQVPCDEAARGDTWPADSRGRHVRCTSCHSRLHRRCVAGLGGSMTPRLSGCGRGGARYANGTRVACARARRWKSFGGSGLGFWHREPS